MVAPSPDRSSTWIRVARAADVESDGPHALSADGHDLVALRAGGKLRVYEGRCPHQGALLGEGELEGSTLVCRNHRWRFDGTTGKRDGGAQCLQACPAEVRGDELWVDVAPLAARAAPKARRTIADLPGPKPWPVVGNTFQLELDRLHQCLEDWAREHGPIYVWRPGRQQPYVTVSDPALIDEVLRARPEVYRRNERVEPVFAELGVAGVFSAEGAAWRPQRKLAMEALSQKHLRGFFPTLHAVADRLRRRWAKAAARAAEIDVQDDLMRFTVDVTTALAFGEDLNTLEGGDDVIQKHLALVLPTFARRLNALVPYWRVIRLPADRRVDKAIAAVHAWIGRLIAEIRARPPAPGRAPANFLEAMLAARDDQGRPFDDEVIFGNAMTMLLAGEDTTANSLAWAVHLMCERPDEVAALRVELDRVMGDAAVPADLETANRLDHATAVASEAMRLHPVAPINFVQANVDTVLGDVEIPAGTVIVVLTRLPATDPRWFAAPERFRPGRWLPGGAEGNHDTSALMPFGSGPRICPGRTLALVEMRVVLATLYKSFELERVGDPDDVREHYSFTVGPKGLRVRIRPRG